MDNVSVAVDSHGNSRRDLRLWKHVHNRNNWLLTGSLRSGQRAAAIMTKLNGHDPYAYLKDVLNRLPT